MKRLIFLFVIALVLCSSCGKAPLNWELEGQWQLKRAELEEGNILTTQDSLYMNLQRNVVQLRKSSPTNHSVFASLGYFTFTGDSIHFDIKLDFQDLHYWGFDGPKQSFKVDEFENKKLVLRNANGYWSFRKF